MKLEIARLAGAALVATGLAALAAAGSHAFELPVVPVPLPTQLSPTYPPKVIAAESALAIAVSKAPFRERRTPAVPYDPLLIGAPPPPPALPKPVLVLAGIVWGSEPLATIEGVPGNEGSTVLVALNVLRLLGFRGPGG